MKSVFFQCDFVISFMKEDEGGISSKDPDWKTVN